MPEEEGGGPDMSGPYRDSSESLLLPQAGTAAGEKAIRLQERLALHFYLLILLTNQELCGILATIVEQSCNSRKGKQSENESKHEKETSNRSGRCGRCVGCGADIYQ
ncbi:MAG: hypothetical protein KH014_12605 [Subdoligranulum variabile]|nr:hypothetical protein [Subdoligranulum variabile]